MANSYLGKVSYMAPEIEKSNNETPYCAYKADIFSLGCVIYFLITGE